MIIVLGVWLGLSTLSFALIMGCCIIAARADRAQGRMERGVRLRTPSPVLRQRMPASGALRPALLSSRLSCSRPPQRTSPG